MNVYRSLLMILSLFVLAGCAAKAEETPMKDQALLYVLHAQKGHVGNGRLALIDVGPKVTYFSDRPARKAGGMPLEKFLSYWAPGSEVGYHENPPSAGFVFFEDNDEKYSDIPVELKFPDYDEGRRTLTFEVKAIADKALPENQRLEQVTLFLNS